MNRDKKYKNNLISQLRNALMESEGRNVYFSILYIIAVLFLSTLSFLIEGKNSVICSFAITLLIYWVLLLYITTRVRNYRIMALVVSFSANFFMLPVLYFLNGAIYNGSVLFFCLGIIGTFFIIDRIYVYGVVAAELAVYVGILIYSAQHDDLIRKNVVMNTITIESVLNFLLAAIVPLLVLLYQAGSYDVQNRNVTNSYNKIEIARHNKNRFLNNMSQELRVPMNAIIGMNEIIIREEDDPVIKELASYIKTSANHLLKIINSIVEYSKLSIKEFQLYPDIYSFKNVIGEVVDSFANELVDENGAFIVSIDEHIPSKLYGDRNRIKEVFMYILFSVFKKNRNRWMSLYVTFDKNEEKHTARIKCKVCVSGSGFINENAGKLKSTRLDNELSQEDAYEEYGLELSICSEILKVMNGNLNIESIEGVGSAISFEFENYIIDDKDMICIEGVENLSVLVYSDSEITEDVWTRRMGALSVPLRVVKGPNSFRKAVEEHAFSHIFIPDRIYDILKDTIATFGIEKNVYVITGRKNYYGDFDECKIIHTPLYAINVSDALNGVWDESKFVTVMNNEEIVFPKAKLLIVDDSIVNLKVLKGILKSYEIDADMSKNAEDALQKIDDKLYDLIILDQIMPGTDGIDLLHMIRNLSNANNKTPIICATADFGQEVGRRLIAEGFTDYLAKPVQQFHLERMLRKYLPRSLAEKRVSAQVSEPEVKTETKEKMPDVDPTQIDYEKGLALIGGSMDAYAAILNSYLREGLKKIDDIRTEVTSEDLGLYVIDVHALKSSSASIGALGISERFKALEFAGRESKRGFIDDNTEETLGLFEMVLNQVRSYLLEKGLLENSAVSIQKSGEVENLEISLVEEIQDSLSKFSLKRCEEIINDINNKNYGAEINEMVSVIKASYDMFDYPKVKVLLQELHDKLG